MATGSINVSLHEQNSHFTFLEHVSVWIYEHPTTVKVLQVASLILGAGMIAPVAFAVPLIGVGAVIALAITGTLVTLSSLVTWSALDIIVPPHHDMKNHVYTPRQCEGGKLYYEGDVPILSLDSDDPFKAGKAHGYLCGEAISRVTKRFDFVLHTLAGEPRADMFPNILDEIRHTIPAEYLREMEGLVEGYNQWASEQYWWKFPKKLTIDDALLIHLMPDCNHFQPDSFENRAPRQLLRAQAVACTALVDRDPQAGLVFARNMDWQSLGVIGSHSLVINRKYTNGLQNTVEVGIPGFIGTLTGMNSQGLSVAMNVSSGYTHHARGMPATFYNRACLERCRNVNEVENFVQSRSPLGPYHLTVADQNRAQSIHFYQSPEGSHLSRRWQENQPLATLNFRYSPTPSIPIFNCEKRQKKLNGFFQSKGNRPLEEALSLRHVNNWNTTHRVVMEPQTKTFRVAFDNAFAGKAALHALPTQRLLG